MRLPLAKVYRAFPELDAFSDAECETFVLRVRTHRRSLTFWPLCGGVAVLVAWLFVMALLWTHLIPRVFGGRSPGSNESDLLMYGSAGVFILGVLAALLAGMMVRDRLLIRAIRSRVMMAACPDCGHSLLGLPLMPMGGGETVRCPECGAAFALVEIGLRHSDLIPRPEQACSGDRFRK